MLLNSSNCAVKYIQGTPGADFDIRLALAKGFSFNHFDAASFGISIDGNFLEGRIFVKEDYEETDSCLTTFVGLEERVGGTSTVRPLRWPNISIGLSQLTPRTIVDPLVGLISRRRLHRR